MNPYSDLLDLRSLGIMVTAAALLALLVRPLRLPSIVAFIVAGLVLEPLTTGVEAGEVVRLIGEAGIALLLFVVGLELSLGKLRDVGAEAAFAGVLQVGVTAGAGFLLLSALGWPAGPAGVVSAAVAFSSTAVAVRLLDERHELDRLHGRLSLGILLVQDVLVIGTLTALAGASGGEARALLPGLLATLLGAVLLVLVATVAARSVLPRAFRWMEGHSEGMFVWGLAWCFLLIMAAEALHLSVEVGAFVAGVALAQLPHAGEIRRRAHPLMVFFLAVFFVTLGVETDLAAARGFLLEGVLLIVLVTLGKLVLFQLLLTRRGRSGETAFRTGITLAQVSEFSFVLVALAARQGLAGEEAVALVGGVGLASIALTSPLALATDGVLARLRSTWLGRFLGPGEEGDAGAHEGPSGHVIVVGMNSLGRTLATELTRRDESVLAVDTDPGKLHGLPCPTLLGNAEYPSVLAEANLGRAKLLVSALNIEDANILLLDRAQRAGIPASIHAFHTGAVEELEALGADHLIVGKDESVRRIAEELRKVGVLG